MQQKEVLACRGASCNVTGVAKRWETPKTLSSLGIPISKYTGTTGQLVVLQHSCKEGVDGVSGSARTPHMGVQGAANTSRSKLWDINSKTCVTGDCAACLLKYTGVPFYSPYFFFIIIIISRPQCRFVFKWRANSRRGEGSSTEWSCWLWQGTDHTGAPDPLLNKSSTQPLNIPAAEMGSTFLPLHPAPFPGDLVADFQSKQKQLTKE